MTTTDVYLGWLSLIPMVWPLVLLAAWVVFGMTIIIGYHVRLLFHCLINGINDRITLSWD